MDKVVLHQHFEERFRAKLSNDLVQGMFVELEVGYRMSFNKGFNQHHLLGTFLDGGGEIYIFPLFEHFLEGVQVPHLESKINLFY